MDVYDEEIIEFWATLNKHNVKYLMIGGFAINMHGHYRSTSDIDLWFNDTDENRDNLGNALEELDISTKEIIKRYQFIPGWTLMHLASGFPLDIMTKVKGLENISFEECLAYAFKVEVEGIVVPFLHLNHLIASKKAANRPKDQIDVIALEEIQREKAAMGKS